MSNGDGQPDVTIDRVQLGPGWCYFEPGERPPSRDELPKFLNQAVTDWLQANPSAVVRTTLPVVSDGMTSGIHLWYDVGEGG
jgi:hypothetical protein